MQLFTEFAKLITGDWQQYISPCGDEPTPDNIKHSTRQPEDSAQPTHPIINPDLLELYEAMDLSG